MQRVSIVIYSMLCPALLGCAMWQMEDDLSDESLAAATLDVLRSQLASDAWMLNSRWSPIAEASSRQAQVPAAERLRWTFTAAEPSPAKLKSPLASWDGFSPLGLRDVLESLDSATAPNADESSDRESRHYLAVLARQDDLIGWNAAILWAQQDPAAAREVEPVLRQLASVPPRYNPQTFAAIDSPQSSSEAKTSGDLQIATQLKDAWNNLRGVKKDKPPKPKANGVSISPSMQSAAAEAWCLVLRQRSTEPTEALASAGRLLERSDLPVAVRGELFRGIARWIRPDLIPRLANAFRVADGDRRAPVEIRLAACEACLVHAVWNVRLPGAQTDQTAGATEYDETTWPSTIWHCQSDPDPRVRETFGRWLAVVRHPKAFRTLKSQRLDSDPKVQQQALISFGQLGTDAAKRELLRQADGSDESVRALAVTALAHWGIEQTLEFADDRSAKVRQAVAEGIASSPSLEAARIARTLLIDESSEVQMSVSQMLDEWPDRLAIPLLLLGMRDSKFKPVRSNCLKQLRQRTHIQAPFPINAPRLERSLAVIELAREYEFPLDVFNNLHRDEPEIARLANYLHLAEIRASLRVVTTNPPHSVAHQQAMEQLLQLAPAELPIVEQFVVEADDQDGDVIYRTVLPRLSAVYGVLVDLENSDLQVRRRGAKALSQTAESVPLSRAVLRRLKRHLIDEQDQSVWRDAMSAVIRNESKEGAEIALIALNAESDGEEQRPTWPDIQILGCRYIAAHGQPRFVQWLLPLFNNRNLNIQLAAVEAAGRCRNATVLDGPKGRSAAGTQPVGLRPLLSHSDQRLRLAASASMSRLGDLQGIRELSHFSYHQEAPVRSAAIKEMGESGQTRFVEHLIRLAWTERDSKVKRAVMLSLDQLVPAHQRPAGLSSTTSDDAKIKLWTAWWDGGKHPTRHSRNQKS